jgi:hypothetical protein
MEYFLLVAGFLCVIGGIVGSFLPVLPDAPLSWIGLLLLYFCDGIETEYWVLGITLFIAIVSGILDYIIPAKGTKHFGGSFLWNLGHQHRIGCRTDCPYSFWICYRSFSGCFYWRNVIRFQRPFPCAKSSNRVIYRIFSFNLYKICCVYGIPGTFSV